MISHLLRLLHRSYGMTRRCLAVLAAFCLVVCLIFYVAWNAPNDTTMLRTNKNKLPMKFIVRQTDRQEHVNTNDKDVLIVEWRKLLKTDEQGSQSKLVVTPLQQTELKITRPDTKLKITISDGDGLRSKPTSRRTLRNITRISFPDKKNDEPETESGSKFESIHRLQTQVEKSVNQSPRAVAAALSGGPAKCKIYNVRKKLKKDFSKSECMTLDRSLTKALSRTEVIVCPYPNEDDVFLSKPLRTHQLWEPHIVRVFMAAVSSVIQSNSGGDVGPAQRRSASSVGVFDIGANVGQYSLLAAGVFGCRVVAVEPYRPNIYRLHKAIRINVLTDKVIVVENAVSDVRDTFELSVAVGNPSGIALTSQDADRYCDEPECPPHATTIFMDDLLEVTNFNVAVMKIDVEGHEHRAFVHSELLLAEVMVAYVFMEWTRMRSYHGSEVDDNEDKRLVQRLVDRLLTLQYSAYGLNELQLLDSQYWFGWPHDILWVHKTAVPPRLLLDRFNAGR